MCAQPGRPFLNAPGRRLRRDARYRSSFPVSVTLLAAGRYERLEAHCKDLSAAGIGVLVAAELTLGEVVSLRFALPDSTGRGSTGRGPAERGSSERCSSESWEVRAVLRHRRGYHYGFEFLSLTEKQSVILKQHIHGLERADFD